MNFNIIKNKLFKPEKENQIVDINLTDVRQIEVPDLKKYLLNGYEEIRKEKIKNEQLEKDLEESNKYKILYESALVTLDEKEKREVENTDKIENYKKRLELKNNEIYSLNDIINNYKLKENEINNKEKEICKTISETKEEAKKEIKNKIINEILNTKGNISKNKVCDIIEKL